MVGRIAGTLAAGVVLAAATASHAVTIDVTFGSSITSLSNAAAVEASIDNAVLFYTQFTNPITVTIDFESVTTGLGSSFTGLGGADYSVFTGQLAADAALNPQNHVLATAVNNLQYGNQKPVIAATSADLRALGFAGGGADPHAPGPDGGTFDGVVSLNTSIMNFTNTPEAGLYGANQVIQHEVDEVLGMGGPSSLPDQLYGANVMGAQDLYRYSAPKTPSFTDDPNAVAYFSIDGGATNIRTYNSDPSEDLGDWKTNCAGPRSVQDANGCPDQPQIGLTLSSPEVIGLEAVGYNLPAVPEPAAWALMIAGFGLTGTALRRRRVGAAVRA